MSSVTHDIKTRLPMRAPFWGATKSEVTKILTLKGTFIAALVAVGVAGVIGFLTGGSNSVVLRDAMAVDNDPLLGGLDSLAISQVAIIVFAVLCVAGELQEKQLLVSLSVCPHRGRLFAAKIWATTGLLVVLATLMTLFSNVASEVALGQYAQGKWLQEPARVFGAIAYLTFMGLVAFFFTWIIRSFITSLVVLLVVTQVLHGVLLSVNGVIKDASNLLPEMAGSSLYISVNAPFSFTIGGLIMMAWVVALGAVAFWRFQVRDL